MKHNYEFHFLPCVYTTLNRFGINQPIQVRTGLHRLWQIAAWKIVDLTTGQVLKLKVGAK